MEDIKTEKKSMWDMMQSMDKGFDSHQEYLDKLEKAYNKAIREIIGPDYLDNFKSSKSK
jgi:hypothetical protein